jgi:hypothetical protein
MKLNLKFILCFIVLSNLIQLKAQVEADSTLEINIPELEDLRFMMDTSFGVFKTKRFSNMQSVFPSFKVYKAYIKDSEGGKQSEYTQFAMYNYVWNNLRVKHSKMMKRANSARIDWKLTTLDSVDYKYSYYDGLEYAYVTWIINHNKKKKYIIKATCIKMEERWYIMDELVFVGALIVKKPKKKK